MCLFVQIPGGDVKALPSNFLINKLLSELDGQSAQVAVPSCEKHEGEELKLFCQPCDQLICRDCILLDHCDHKYAFVKDIYPSEKEKIEKVVHESRANILALETSLESIEYQEGEAKIKRDEVSQNVDNFIDTQIELLEKKRQTLKGQLQKIAQDQKEHHETQKKSFTSSLNSMKRSVEFAEKALRRGNEVEVLAAKNQIMQQLTGINSATAKLQPRSMISYDLEIDSPLDSETVEKMAGMRAYDEEYTVLMRNDETPLKAIMKKFFSAGRSSRDFKEGPFISKFDQLSCFEIHRKRNDTAQVEPVNQVQVEIRRAGSIVDMPRIDKKQDGSFSFSYRPIYFGCYQYEIEVIINGRYVKGSPFPWKVTFMD